VKHSERGNARAMVAAAVALTAGAVEAMLAEGRYSVTCTAPAEHLRGEYAGMRDEAFARGLEPHFNRMLAGHGLGLELLVLSERDAALLLDIERIPLVEQWRDDFLNTVVTQGKNDLLDKYLAGSAYTAAWYCGLISSVSFSAIAAADVAAQINGTNGWKEAAATNAPNYSQGNRVAFTFASASAGSKATSAASAFSITGAGTVKGCFAVSTNTKEGTTGVLLSAGLFTGGDKVVANTDTLNVSYSLAV
jgi:hypothetical protein